MSSIRWLSRADGPGAFPDAAAALREPNGLLAAGGCLEPSWLLESYARGIFPWYEAGQPILWWSPDPRTVLFPERLVVTRSLRKTVRSARFEVTADRDFDAVITGCAEPRTYSDGTWITDEMAAAYKTLHRLGWAHSFEAWQGEELAGGLYGIAIGRVFFGESMFTRVRDASKVAFVHATRFLARRGFALIDCQLPSSHLHRFGACDVPRAEFLESLRTLLEPARAPGSWQADFAAEMAATPAAT